MTDFTTDSMTDYYCTDDRIMSDFDWNDSTEETESLSEPTEPILPCFITGLNHTRLYKSCRRVAKITCEKRIYRIFIDPTHNGAILVIPDMHCDIWFPLGMTIRDVIYHYFGDRLLLTNDSVYTPMSHATFCQITM